jgi:hypothetical protein
MDQAAGVTGVGEKSIAAEEAGKGQKAVLVEAIREAAKNKGRRSPVWAELDGYVAEIDLAVNKEKISFPKLAQIFEEKVGITVTPQTLRKFAVSRGLWKKKKKGGKR